MNNLTPKEWRKSLDLYLTTGVMASWDYERMTDIQITVIQEIKRSFARQKRK